MTLKKQLTRLTEQADKLTYEEIIDTLKEAAKSGKSEVYVDAEDILDKDLATLKTEELDIKFLEGENYSRLGCYKISW